MPSYVPKFGDDSVNFGLLNRGKRSLSIDLKQPGTVRQNPRRYLVPGTVVK